MTAFALFLFLAAEGDQVQILRSTPSALFLRVEFSEFKKNEQQPIARFVISETPPTYVYDRAEFDSSHNSLESEESEPVRIGSPVRLNGASLYPILIEPSYVKNNMRHFVKSAEIRIDLIPSSMQIELSPSLGETFEDLILNFRNSGDQRPRGYLIIAPSEFVDEIQPLAQWKEKKGWDVEIRTTAQTGSTPTLIRDYIANAYNTWSPRPEYVLLVGDVNHVPAFTNPSATDHPYTLIDGDDFLSELLIGRLSVSIDNELNTVVAKIIGYETNPTMSDPSWYSRALMVGANLPSGMTTPVPTKRWVRDKFFEYGFNAVDTVFDPMPPSGITASINNGVTFVNYRSGDGNIDSWPFPFFGSADVYALNNGWKLPIVTSIVCWTGNFGAGTCFGEAWLRAGNPVAPKGAVAFFGASSPQSHTRWNNCLDYGVYWGILEDDISSLGAALYRGKMELYLNFPNDTTITSGSSFYFHAFNLLGDPSLEVWTGIPDSFIVTHVPSIQTGSSSFSVHVTNSASQPVAGAMASLYKSGEVKEIEFTDETGNAAFNFTTSTQDTLFVTITKHNFKPYSGHTMVNDASVFVGYDSHTISDPGGNNNGEVNPGETIELGVTLRNYGTSTTATNVSARLSTNDLNVTITDSIKTYGNIVPGATATTAPYIFDVSQIIRDDHILKFTLDITSDQGTWSGSIWITARAPNLVHQRTQVLDGNGILEPGETRDFLVWVENTGGFEGMNVSGILRSANSGLIVTDSMGYFGNILAGDSAANSGNPFTLSANSSLTPGTSVRFSLILNGNNGFVDTTGFRLTVGIIDSTSPLGPDAYGYYAYDNGDTDYSEAPVYGWIEIDPRPPYNGPGDSISLGADETKTIPLPFSFKFYGNWYDRISICSDGYIAMDSTWIADMYNWHIPGTGGPPLLVSPFWDDLDPNATDSSGVVCYWYDATNHRFIIEYSRIQHIHDYANPTPSELQTFEVILYDPLYNPTQTGDGEVVFQYLDITNDDIWHNYATVGIENYDHTTGIEYTYADIYPTAAASLTDSRAIKFTTDPPDTFTGVSELLTPTGRRNILYISPNPSRGELNIRYRIQDTRYTIPNLRLAIYDISGRVVKSFNLESTIMNHESSLLWDRIDASGRRVPGGIYFIILQGDQFSITDKVVLID
ncbi:MAG: T9SS type A sorting domain-containing protein [candidate division WOR-3 bacterium]|nr:MAG: T9SS type A sorting domain-containing protein [candidate division WOR-3 bacterium]